MTKRIKRNLKDRLHALLATLIIKAGRIFARLSDRTLIAFLSLIEKLLRKKNPEHPSLVPVGEIKDIFENSPEGNRLVRDILLESREEQVVSFLKGTFRHYSKPRVLPFAELEEQLRDLHSGPKMKIAVIGSGYDAQMMRRHYSDTENCTLLPYPGKFDSEKFDALLNQVDALEIGHVDHALEEILGKATEMDLALSLHYSLLENPARAKKIFDILDRARKPHRILYPPEFYPPVRMVKTLIENEEVGELTMIRIRATLGRSDKEIAPAPFGPDILAHEAFDHFPMLVFFAGQIEKVGAYINSFDPEHSGQALVDVKYKAPGCYGLLDCTYAPKMSLRTNHLPYDMDAEITGTDGVIWLRRGMARRNATEPIYVRIGQTSYSIGVESGMDLEYNSTYSHAAKQFYAMFTGIRYPVLKKADFLSAIQAKAKAHESNQGKKVVSL